MVQEKCYCAQQLSSDSATEHLECPGCGNELTESVVNKVEGFRIEVAHCCTFCNTEVYDTYLFTGHRETYGWPDEEEEQEHLQQEMNDEQQPT